jgi:hypothetical protein
VTYPITFLDGPLQGQSTMLPYYPSLELDIVIEKAQYKEVLTYRAVNGLGDYKLAYRSVKAEVRERTH